MCVSQVSCKDIWKHVKSHLCLQAVRYVRIKSGPGKIRGFNKINYFIASVWVQSGIYWGNHRDSAFRLRSSLASTMTNKRNKLEPSVSTDSRRQKGGVGVVHCLNRDHLYERCRSLWTAFDFVGSITLREWRDLWGFFYTKRYSIRHLKETNLFWKWIWSIPFSLFSMYAIN